jgi:hypothetical protein
VLPSFLHIGVAKAASTWLWTIFQEHPDIYVPTAKVLNYSGKLTKPDNVNFFVADFDRGLDWYEKTYFAQWNGEKAVGETSNSYILDELALQRISKMLPNVKLTMILRNPIERALLQFATRKHNRGMSGGFREILDIHSWQMFRMFIEPGFYYLHLTRVLRLFPKERVLPLIYDDLASDPRAFLRQVFSFLEVDVRLDLPSIDRIIGFPRPEEPDTPDSDIEAGVDSDMHERLSRIFADQISLLEDLLDRDLSIWR